MEDSSAAQKVMRYLKLLLREIYTLISQAGLSIHAFSTYQVDQGEA
jgi:hypothetical protein